MKKIIILIVLAILIIVGIFSWQYIQPILFQEVEVEELSLSQIEENVGDTNTLPVFKEISADFTHKYDGKNPFLGSALIDIDNDGTDEIYVGGGTGQEDALLQYDGSTFKNIATEVGLNITKAGYGAVSIDADNDGDTDLLVSREDDIYLYTNTNSTFNEQRLNISFESHIIPLSVSTGDINKDGWMDLYVSTFIKADRFKPATFNDPNHGTLNIALLNNGDNTFTNITEESNLTFKQNTFLSSFVDLDNDGWQDLVVSPNTDQVRIYQNLQNNTFKLASQPTERGFWMGLAIGDIDNDGDQDLFLSNSGNSIPENISRGDLTADQKLDTEWALIRNDGNFQFTQINEEKKVTGFEFAWGAVLEDFNLNGTLDLMVMENYIKWPAHKLNPLSGRLLLQQEDETYAPITTVANAENKLFGITPLSSDFNKDGYPDLIFTNVDGPVRALINEGGENHYVKLTLPDNTDTLGARVTLETTSGKKIHKQFVSSTGLISDQSNQLIFGLGKDTPDNLKIQWPSGEEQIIKDISINTEIKP